MENGLLATPPNITRTPPRIHHVPVVWDDKRGLHTCPVCFSKRLTTTSVKVGSTVCWTLHKNIMRRFKRRGTAYSRIDELSPEHFGLRKVGHISVIALHDVASCLCMVRWIRVSTYYLCVCYITIAMSPYCMQVLVKQRGTGFSYTHPV